MRGLASRQIQQGVKMNNQNDIIQELDSLPSENIPQTEPLTFQSKGRGFESPRLHFEAKNGESEPPLLEKVNGSIEELQSAIFW